MDNIIIEKVINNNIISAYEKSGAEVIVMGRGIGFKKKQGEEVPADQISKIFRIKSRTLAEQFKELLANMPLERVRISDEIISHAKDHLKLKLNQSIYVTLTDHINFAIERVSQGIEPQNALLWEIKRFYPQEFQLGIYALELIQDRLDILLPEDEAGFIALHFVNAEYGTDIRDAVKFPDQMQAIVDIVERDLGILLDESSLHYERFMTHIREQDYVIALAIDGKTPDSVELSQKIEKLGVSGISSIAFVIGGSLGLSESVLKRADYKLSFSRMTFPHQLMQMILLEQIYRSYRIMNHEPYHK